MSDVFFQGNVQVHLQGKEALLPVETRQNNRITYFIGGQDTALLVRDYRQDPIHAAHLAISRQDGKDFARVFNQPAYAKILISEENEEENIEIDLLPADDEQHLPVLWMGILDEPQIPAYKVDWEFLKPLDEDKVAFAILVR
jgi:hypothetical protein